MFLDISNGFAVIQELKTRGRKAEDKRPHNSVCVECLRDDRYRQLFLYMYVSRFDLCNKSLHFLLLFSIEFKHPS